MSRPPQPSRAVFCGKCKQVVKSWGVEPWRACPKCHAREGLVELQAAASLPPMAGPPA